MNAAHVAGGLQHDGEQQQPEHAQPRFRLRRARGHAYPHASRLRRHQPRRRHPHCNPVRRLGDPVRRCAAAGRRPALGGLHDYVRRGLGEPEAARRLGGDSDNCAAADIFFCDNAAIWAVALQAPQTRMSSTRPPTTTTAPATPPTAHCARRSTPPTPRPLRASQASRSPSPAATRSRSRCSDRRCRRSPCRSRSTARPSPASPPGRWA